MANEDQIWEGRQWRVIKGFLVGEQQSGAYVLAWPALQPRTQAGAPSLHVEMAGKKWVDYEDFCEAYRAATDAAGIDVPNIDALEQAGRERRRNADEGPA